MARKLPISFAESAISDLEGILQYYKEQDAPDAGRRIVAQVMKKVENLALHPDMGRVVPEYGMERLRELIDPPFRIVYLREKAKLRVVRVWRSERLMKLPGK